MADGGVGFKNKRKLGSAAFDETDSQRDSQVDPSLSFNPDALYAQRETREESYPGNASIGPNYVKRRGVTFDPFLVREMDHSPDTGKITAVVYTQEQLDSLQRERKDYIDAFKNQIRELKRRVLTRTKKATLNESTGIVKTLKGTFFERDASADYEYTPEDFSKKNKLYLEDLIALNEEYIELCKELLPEDSSQLSSIKFAQNKLKRNLEDLIELLTESVENEPGSKQVEEWNASITKYREMLRKLGEEEPGLKGGVKEEEDFGGRKKPKRRTIKRKLTKKFKTRKFKNKRKTSKKRSKKTRRR